MKYQVSQDGVIYSINDDTTITKYGRIQPDGSIEPTEGHESRRNLPATLETVGKARRRPVWGYWVAIILLLLACGSAAFVIWMNNQKIDELDVKVKELGSQNSTSVSSIRQKDQLIENLQTQLAEAGRKRVEAEDALNKLTDAASATAPMIITSAELGNVASGNKPLGRMGEPLKASTLCFLKIRLNYYGLRQGITQIGIKLYNPSGDLIGNSRYSFTNDCPIEKGPNHTLELGSYGFKEAGQWRHGSYLLELYASGVCIYRHTFTITQ